MAKGTTARAVLGIAFLLLALGCGGSGGDDKPPVQPVLHDVTPGMGVMTYQVSFQDPQNPMPDTTWGRLVVDPASLAKEAGMEGGWLNVATENGWAVVNLPMPPGSEGRFSVYFDLGLGGSEPVKQIGLHVKLSNVAVEGIQDVLGEPTPYPVSAVKVAEKGLGPNAEIEPYTPPWARSLRARVRIPAFITQWTQAETNEQCAQNQCATMGTANAFQYLEDRGEWTVPNVHDMGLGGDATLVGQLDILCSRPFTSRSVGNGIPADQLVDGALDYIASNGMAAGMTFRHQDEGWGSSLPAANYNAHGLTSQYDGGVPTWNWLWSRVSGGCGVVAGYSHSSGGHIVRVTGVKVDDAGNQWMRYTHDSLQTGSDPTDALGLETVWVQLSDLDGDGILNLGAVSRELRFVWAACP